MEIDPRRKTGAKKEIIYKLGLFLLSISIALIVSEFIIRKISPPSLYSPLLALYPKNKIKIELRTKINGFSPVGIISTNSWGLRGDEPPAPSQWEKYFTMVAIGGSTTECIGIDDHKTWPYLLQKNLKKKYPKAWIGNAGIIGHTTRGHIIFMKEAIPKIRPDAVILLVGLNDLGFSIAKDNRGALKPNDYYKPGWRRKIFLKSRLAQILYTWKLIVFDKVFVEKKSSPLRFISKPLEGNPMPLPDDLKTLLPFLTQYRENIKEIIKLGKSMHMRVIFLTQPMLFDDTPYWRGMEGEFYWIKETRGKLSAATYWKMLDIYNKELIEICKEKNVEYLDLASLIPHNDSYFFDPVHFNEIGTQLVAEKVAELF